MPHGVLCGELLLHDSCCFMCGFSLTDRMVFYVGTFSYTPGAVLCGDFSYTPHAVSRGEFLMHTRALFCGEFLLHVPCCFMCGDSLTRSMLLYVRRSCFFVLFFCCCFYMALAVLCGEFLLHTSYCFIWWFLLHDWYLFVGRKFVFHALCYLISGICLTHPMQGSMERFSNNMQCVLSCVELFLSSLCCFMWEISLTILRSMY